MEDLVSLRWPGTRQPDAKRRWSALRRLNKDLGLANVLSDYFLVHTLRHPLLKSFFSLGPLSYEFLHFKKMGALKGKLFKAFKKKQNMEAPMLRNDGISSMSSGPTDDTTFPTISIFTEHQLGRKFGRI